MTIEKKSRLHKLLKEYTETEIKAAYAVILAKDLIVEFVKVRVKK
jgi:hypothetical protein